MFSKRIPALGITCVLGLTACEGGSVGDEGASSESGSEESTNTSPTTTMTSGPTTTSPTTTTDPDTTATDPDTTATDPDTSATDPDTTDTEPMGCPADVDFGMIDTSGCAALATDYTPGADDDYAACVSDDGTWVLVAGAPSSADRTVAYEDIIELLRSGATPTAKEFTAARAIYATKNGIESRVLRREDLHYPPVDEADQDPKLTPDRQCTVGTNADDYPDRCVGPARIQPIVDEAFAAGESGDGDPNVHAARIDAALQWFSFVSVYKESASCGFAPGDCDSHWAYYNGAIQPDQEPIGIALNFREIDPAIDDAIWDAMLGIRCWRDLYPADGDPTFADLPEEGQEMFYAAHEQLDNALWHAWSRQLRAYIEVQPTVCDSAADANWAFVQVAGPILTAEATARDGAMGALLDALWANDAPTAAELQAGVAALDMVFPCPQCESCPVPQEWGY